MILFVEIKHNLYNQRYIYGHFSTSSSEMDFGSFRFRFYRNVVGCCDENFIPVGGGIIEATEDMVRIYGDSESFGKYHR